MGAAPSPRENAGERDEEIEAFLDVALDRVSLRAGLTSDLRDELRSHILDFVEAGGTREEALRDFGDPAEAAENFRLLEADLPVTRDPAAVGAILAVAAGWALLAGPFSLLPSVGWGLAGGDAESVRLLANAGQSLRALLAALSGVAAYRLSLGWRGNPRRVIPFVGLSMGLLLFAFLTRMDLFVLQPLPHPRWHAFLIADLPGLASYSYDLDLTGLSTVCRPGMERWAEISLPLRPLGLHLGVFSLGLVAVGTARAILRDRQVVAHG